MRLRLGSGFIAWFVGTFVFYWWHRLRHADGFWHVFHQLHHSPGRIEMLAQFIFRHPRYFALLILCVFAVGINSYKSIPRQEEPSITNMVAIINTFFPGATPAAAHLERW